MATQTAGSTALVTPIGYMSFPNLFTPKPRLNSQELAYSATLIFDAAAQASAEYAALKAAAFEACKAKFGSRMNDPSFVQRIKTPFNDAGVKSNLKGYEPGMTYINCWSKFPPGVVGPQRQPMLEADVYAGQMARFSVQPYAYDQLGNVGVSFGLSNVQIAKVNMPRFDNRRSAEDTFGELPVEDGQAIQARQGQNAPTKENPF